ncbi:MAG: hypothetical protein H7039_15150, partial [Bryobacteraceae bacterium]|nr:hypothetical protein [Bryobacteraceae bacterium]
MTTAPPDFAEFIAENYESAVDLYWDYAREGLVTARFGVKDGTAVTVTFESFAEAGWRTGFIVEKGDVAQVVFSAFAIFNGVMQALAEFLAVRQPQIVVLVSKDDQLT